MLGGFLMSLEKGM